VGANSTTSDDKNCAILCSRAALLFKAAKHGDLVTLQKLVDHYGPDLLHARYPHHGGTVLHSLVSTELGNEKLGTVIEKLVDLGADINARADNGATPLHWAAGCGSLEVVSALLRKGELTWRVRKRRGQSHLLLLNTAACFFSGLHNTTTIIALLLLRRLQATTSINTIDYP